MELAGRPSAAPAPTLPTERHVTLDVLRGLAVLGILWMNILEFGLPNPGYAVPHELTGGSEGANLYVWMFEWLFIEGTLRGLFTLLFGAGVVLYTQRMEDRGVGVRTADLYLRRCLWLMLFGLLNAYIFAWPGDVLFFYGLIGIPLFVLRNVDGRRLMLVSLPLLLVPTVIYAFMYVDYQDLAARVPALLEAEAAGESLTVEEYEDIYYYEAYLAEVVPDPEYIEEQVEAVRGGYWSALKYAAAESWYGMTVNFVKYGLWEFMAMMIFGMALLKSGALTLGWSTQRYLLMLVLGYGIGVGVNYWEVNSALASDFNPDIVLMAWYTTYDLGRIPTTLGHLALIMLVLRFRLLGPVAGVLAAVGRMALTNYVTQSVICLFVFTGAGLALFGQLERYQLWYVVGAIWLLQLVWSPLWLSYFRYGPLEWVWRSATRWERVRLWW